MVYICCGACKERCEIASLDFVAALIEARSRILNLKEAGCLNVVCVTSEVEAKKYRESVICCLRCETVRG